MKNIINMENQTEKQYVAALDQWGVATYYEYKTFTPKRLEKEAAKLMADLEDNTIDADVRQVTEDCLRDVRFIQSLRAKK